MILRIKFMITLQEAFLHAFCGFIFFTTKPAKQAQRSQRGICIYPSFDYITLKQIPTLKVRAPCGHRWLFRLLYSLFRFLSENFSPCPL